MILCIETSTTNCSVSLVSEGKCEAFMEHNDGYSHAEKLSVFIDELLTLHEVEKTQLKAVAVGKGPGSYTGLRIGVSTAKGIAFGLAIPLLSIPSLQIMCFSESLPQNSNALFVPMTDARRMEVYMEGYRGRKNQEIETQAQIVDEAFLGAWEKEEKVYLFGSGAEKLKEIIKPFSNIEIVHHILPSAKDMAALAQQKWDAKKFEDIAYFEPFYLKDFVATTPKKRV